MKNILFIIAVLLSFTGMAQTVGQLRYDTVKMYKVGGTTELILQNASSGVVGGVLRNVINGRTVFQTVVDTVFKNATADSFVYYIGGVRRAFKDSSGTGTYARDSIIAGRGLTGTFINANKVQLDNDSAIYIVTQINDTTLSFTHYDGRIDTVTIVSSGGGGGSGWGFTGDNITAGQFLGTTNDEDLVFKRNSVEAGRIGYDISLGIESLIANTTGSGNIAVGYRALKQNTTGSGSIAIGFETLPVSNGGSNTVIGIESGQGMTSGISNTSIGFQSSNNLTTGSYNTAVGSEATFGAGTDSAGAFGHDAVASTRQMAFSPHFKEFKATGITGASNSGYVLTTDGTGIATFQAAGGGSSLFPTTGTGTATGNVEGALDGNTLSITGGNVGIGTTTPDSLFTVNGNIKSVSLNTKSIYSDNGELLIDLTDPFSAGWVSIPGLLQVPSIASGIDDIVINLDQGFLSAQPLGSSYNMGNVDWKNRLLKDSNTATQLGTQGLASVNWQDRQLVGTDGTTSILSWGTNKVGLGTTSPDSLFDVQLGAHFKRGVRASGLPSNQTYSKSLGVTSDGTFYLKDTLAVSGVYALINANTTGSAATLTTARKINGVDFNGSADIGVDGYLLGIQALGSAIIGYNLDGNPSNGVSVQNMASQRIYFTAVRLNKAQTVTGVKWIQTTAGDYTSNNYNGVGLYSYSGGTLTLVASSTDDGNIWKATANTMASKAFTTPYSAAAGIYFVAFLYSSSAQTTAPALQVLGPAGTTNLILDLTNSAKTSSLLSGQTSLPSPTQAMSGLSGVQTEFKTFIY